MVCYYCRSILLDGSLYPTCDAPDYYGGGGRATATEETPRPDEAEAEEEKTTFVEAARGGGGGATGASRQGAKDKLIPTRHCLII